MAAEAAPDDFEQNLASLGLDFSTDLSDIGVPIIDSGPLKAMIIGNRPPDVDLLTPLPLAPDLAEVMSRPILDDRMVPIVRRALIANIRRLAIDPANDLNIDEEVLDDMRLGVSEAMQNAARESGIWQMNAARTPEGNVYIDVRNLSLDFPANCVHDRPNGRPLRYGTVQKASPEARSVIDQSGWGMYLVGSLAVRNTDGSPAAGLYDQTYVEVPIVGSNRITPITRKVAWSIYGRNDETMRPRLKSVS